MVCSVSLNKFEEPGQVEDNKKWQVYKLTFQHISILFTGASSLVSVEERCQETILKDGKTRRKD